MAKRIATPPPYVVLRHDNEDGSIQYEIWNEGPEHYNRVASLNDRYDSLAKLNAEFIVKCVNAYKIKIDIKSDRD